MIMFDITNFCWTSPTDLCWHSLAFMSSSHQLQGYHGCLGDILVAELLVNKRFSCTMGTSREGILTEARLVWDILSGAAAHNLQWAPMGRWDLGLGPKYHLLHPRWPFQHGRKNYTSNRLQMSLPRESRQDSGSEVTVFILVLELWCTFYCYHCLSGLLRNAHTPQRFRIKWKTE